MGKAVGAQDSLSNDCKAMTQLGKYNLVWRRNDLSPGSPSHHSRLQTELVRVQDLLRVQVPHLSFQQNATPKYAEPPLSK